MMELPEILTISKQVNDTLSGKIISQVFTPTSLHKFAFFHGDPESYKPLLTGKKIISAIGSGIFIDVLLTNDTHLVLGDGVNIKYGDIGTKIPNKYQLLLTFEDDTFVSFNIAMYGAIFAYKGAFDNKYYIMSMQKTSPFDDKFDEAYFNGLFINEKKTLSVKAFIATEQRIPGVGNGVLQDILFNARINPKRKIDTLNDKDKSKLFHSLKATLKKMKEQGGRNTETTLFGEKGGYQTILSSKTYKDPCPVCGSMIIKESFLGGSIYYCPNCQPLIS